MGTKMNINEIIAEVDARLKIGEDTKAESRLMEAIVQCTESEPDNLVGQSVLLNELGGFYRARGVYDKGETAYLKAKALLEELQSHVFFVADEPPSGCCACAEGARRTETVLTNHTKTQNYATTLNNLAGLYRMAGDPQKAAETFDAAIAVYEDCEGEVAPDHLASVYSNKGLMSLDLKDPAAARPMFLKAKAILEVGGVYPFALGTTISNLGFAAIMERKYAEAAEHFDKAKILFESCGAGDMAQNCVNLLAKLGMRK